MQSIPSSSKSHSPYDPKKFLLQDRLADYLEKLDQRAHFYENSCRNKKIQWLAFSFFFQVGAIHLLKSQAVTPLHFVAVYLCAELASRLLPLFVYYTSLSLLALYDCSQSKENLVSILLGLNRAEKNHPEI